MSKSLMVAVIKFWGKSSVISFTQRYLFSGGV